MLLVMDCSGNLLNIVKSRKRIHVTETVNGNQWKILKKTETQDILHSVHAVDLFIRKYKVTNASRQFFRTCRILILNMKLVLMFEFRNGVTNTVLHLMICQDGAEDVRIEVRPQ